MYQKYILRTNCDGMYELIENQQDIDIEYVVIVNEHFWELIED